MWSSARACQTASLPLVPQDESVSVREAAVSLLGRHIAHNQALALRLFPTLARAATDPGTSVRKAAIKILWESCIRAPGFPRATGAWGDQRAAGYWL
jgi:cohesin loading factor subunit SCC2